MGNGGLSPPQGLRKLISHRSFNGHKARWHQVSTKLSLSCFVYHFPKHLLLGIKQIWSTKQMLISHWGIWKEHKETPVSTGAASENDGATTWAGEGSLVSGPWRDLPHTPDNTEIDISPLETRYGSLRPWQQCPVSGYTHTSGQHALGLRMRCILWPRDATI